MPIMMVSLEVSYCDMDTTKSGSNACYTQEHHPKKTYLATSRATCFTRCFIAQPNLLDNAIQYTYIVFIAVGSVVDAGVTTNQL